MNPFYWTGPMYVAHKGMCAWDLKYGQRLKLHEQLRKMFFKLHRRRGKIRCAVCGLPLSHATATLDHIIPLSRGGSYEPGNLTLSCAKCNNRRGNQWFHMFRFYRRLSLGDGWKHPFTEAVLTLVADSL